MLLEIRLVNPSRIVGAKLIDRNCPNCLELVDANRIANDVSPEAGLSLDDRCDLNF